MASQRSSIRQSAGIGLASVLVTLSSPVIAQSSDIDDLPADMQSAPIVTEGTETILGEDGVETIVRTRRIESNVPYAPNSGTWRSDDGYTYPVQGYAPQGYTPGANVVERDQWIAECERRTSGRAEREKGNIIGGLLGAVAGGILGNRIAGSGDRLAGTLIGAGTGGLGGALLGGLIGGGKKDDRYDCAAALDSYLSQYGRGPVRIAQRSIAAPVQAYPVYPAPSYYGYPYAPAYSYSYAPPQQVVYVPIRYEQQQRVVVRETVREETYEVPGAARVIENPAPQRGPRLIKDPRPAPTSPKLIKQ